RHGTGLVGPAAPQVDHHLAVDVDGERGAEVFSRLEFGCEQLAQGLESGAAGAAQRRRVIAHMVSVQKSQVKPTPMGRGGIDLTILLPNGGLACPACQYIKARSAYSPRSVSQGASQPIPPPVSLSPASAISSAARCPILPSRDRESSGK